MTQVQVGLIGGPWVGDLTWLTWHFMVAKHIVRFQGARGWPNRRPVVGRAADQTGGLRP
ncbi:hypothetical protein [Octadecabacter sp. R77987]|uniref:hypothetical protein n=1 Tax=Octadecabacter sp. R77987 TaxID=3093874 RepID=UPI00366EAE99